MRNDSDDFLAGCPNNAIGKNSKGDDPCEACCECECDEGVPDNKGKCMEEGCAVPLDLTDPDKDTCDEVCPSCGP